MLSRLGWKGIHAEHATTMSLPLHGENSNYKKDEILQMYVIVMTLYQISPNK